MMCLSREDMSMDFIYQKHPPFEIVNLDSSFFNRNTFRFIQPYLIPLKKIAIVPSSNMGFATLDAPLSLLRLALFVLLSLMTIGGGGGGVEL